MKRTVLTLIIFAPIFALAGYLLGGQILNAAQEKVSSCDLVPDISTPEIEIDYGNGHSSCCGETYLKTQVNKFTVDTIRTLNGSLTSKFTYSIFAVIGINFPATSQLYVWGSETQEVNISCDENPGQSTEDSLTLVVKVCDKSEFRNCEEEDVPSNKIDTYTMTYSIRTVRVN